MTCREKLKKEHPYKVDPRYTGGCSCCPSTYGYMDKPSYCKITSTSNERMCTACWDREIPGTEEKKEEPKIDIHKIIDDAMEKKDRTVSIYIGQGCVTVNVTPYEKEEPAHWIYNSESERYPFECSACGNSAESATLYCPICGEQLMLCKEDEHNPLAHPEFYVSDVIAMINDMTDAQRAKIVDHLEWLRNGYPKETEVESDD